MADEQLQKHNGPRPGTPKPAETASNGTHELERMRLENENLRQQLAIAEANRQSAEANLRAAQAMEAAAEAMKPKDQAAILAEAQQREDAVVARMRKDRAECKRKLEEGPNKYWVHLAHQIPWGRSLQQPELLVGAASPDEAVRKYKDAVGIRATAHEAAVVAAVEGEECNSAELIALAEQGYRKEMT